MNTHLKKLSYAALCLAIAFALPFLTASNRELGEMLSPMHIPVFLCGFICGPVWGLIVGIAAPLLRSLIFSMPPMIKAIPMMFELAAYGLSTGIFYILFPKKIPYVYVTLILSMLLGRIVKLAYALIVNTSFVFADFISDSITTTLPGIALHLLLVPIIVIALKRAKLVIK